MTKNTFDISAKSEDLKGTSRLRVKEQLPRISVKSIYQSGRENIKVDLVEAMLKNQGF